MLDMLRQSLYMYVASIYSKCFIYFRHMLQVFYLNVAYVAVDITYVTVAIHVCCKRMFQIFHLLHTYVVESSFMLQVFHE
jgi:hypothetical protein